MSKKLALGKPLSEKAKNSLACMRSETGMLLYKHESKLILETYAARLEYTSLFQKIDSSMYFTLKTQVSKQVYDAATRSAFNDNDVPYK
jgi:hypothetical protein